MRQLSWPRARWRCWRQGHIWKTERHFCADEYRECIRCGKTARKWLVSFHCKDCGWEPVQPDNTCRHCGGHIVNVCHGEAPKRDA